MWVCQKFADHIDGARLLRFHVVMLLRVADQLDGDVPRAKVVEPDFHTDHLPQQEIVPAKSLMRLLGIHDRSHEVGIEDAGLAQSVGGGEELADHRPEVLAVLLHRIEGEAPFPLLQNTRRQHRR